MRGTTAVSRATEPPRASRWRRLRLVLGIGCRLVLAAVFLMAALSKITDLQAFAAHVALHANLPAPVEWVVIRLLPWLELICGACLVLGHARREAAAVAAVLLFLFLVHGLINWGSPCGCFLFPPLEASPPLWWPTLRNSLLLACSVWVLLEK